MSHFDNIIQEFQQKRIERELKAQQVKYERLQQLQEMAELADLEMRQRRPRNRSNHYYNTL